MESSCGAGSGDAADDEEVLHGHGAQQPHGPTWSELADAASAALSQLLAALATALSRPNRRAMANNLRVFAAQGGAGPHTMNPRNVAIGGVALLALLLVVTSLRSDPAAVKLAALEQKLYLLEQKEAQTRLALAQEVQKAMASDLSTMLSSSKVLGGGARAFPPVLRLPAHLQKRILVTGGAGFVGSHLVDALMLQGHAVTVIDNLFTGRMSNLQHWLGHPNFRFEQHDVIEPWMQEVDQIYHLACPASPPHYQYNPIKTIKTSTMGTMNMLGLAKRTYARLLFTSTSEVYGDPEVHPQAEDYKGSVNVWGPRSCYDEGKRVAETMCYTYMRELNVQVRVARIFNTFGPRMHPSDGRVVSNFIIQALQGKKMTIYGDGSQTRSFQFVQDLVTGLIKLMNSDATSPVNIGNPQEYTIQQFAEKIRDLVNPAAVIEHLPATKDDPRKRRPDIALAKRLLNWEPKVSVDLGLARSIAYFAKELEMPVPPAVATAVEQFSADALDDPEATGIWTGAAINAGLTDAERGIVEKDRVDIIVTE